MSLALKSILNNVLTQSGFLERDSFTGSSDPDDKQMIAIANRVAYEIFNFYDWSELREVGVINLIEGQNIYDLPSDYQSYVPDSAWETDGSRKVDVPVSEQEWYQYKFSSLTSGGTIRARFYGNTIEVIEPFGGGGFSYEYVTKYPIRSEYDIGIEEALEGEWSIPPALPANVLGSFWDEDYWSSEGVKKEFFTADSDTWLLDDQLLILGIQAHWQQTKQMPSYMEHMANYMVKMNEAIGRSNAGQTIGGVRRGIRRDPYTKLWVS